MYVDRTLLYIRALTPLHVGVGRGYGAYVDLPIQRDEFGFPCIWSSSLKGSIKSWIAKLDRDAYRCLGPEPDELERAEAKQSHVVFTDAKLVLVPVRVISGVYAYATSLHLLNNLAKYLEVVEYSAGLIGKDIIQKLESGVALVSRGRLLHEGKLLVNEVELRAEVVEDLVAELGLDKALPDEISREVFNRGLALIPDGDNASITVVNRSMLLQYRVRLERETKKVSTGPWSEEFVPAETIFASLVLCTGGEIRKKTDGIEEKIKCSKDMIVDAIKHANIIFIGGKETIGRGLVKLYPHSPR